MIQVINQCCYDDIISVFNESASVSLMDINISILNYHNYEKYILLFLGILKNLLNSEAVKNNLYQDNFLIHQRINDCFIFIIT